MRDNWPEGTFRTAREYSRYQLGATEGTADLIAELEDARDKLRGSLIHVPAPAIAQLLDGILTKYQQEQK